MTYDITDDRRRTAVYKRLRGFGDRIQYSVFRCDLSDRRRIDLIAALYELIDHASDQVLVIDLGPVDGRASACVSSIGRAYANPERTVVRKGSPSMTIDGPIEAPQPRAGRTPPAWALRR